MPARTSRARLAAQLSTSTTRKVCDIPMADSSKCVVAPRLQLTRVDGTTFNACTRHYNRLVELMRRRPEAYAPLVVGKI